MKRLTHGIMLTLVLGLPSATKAVEPVRPAQVPPYLPPAVVPTAHMTDNPMPQGNQPAPGMTASPTIACCPPCCEPCGRGGGFNTGMSLLILTPRFEENPAYSISASQGISLTNRLDEFSYETSITPRIWFGYESEGGVGIRTRYWWFQQGAKSKLVDNPTLPGGQSRTVVSSNLVGVQVVGTQPDGGPQLLDFTSNLRLYVWDVEGSYDLSCGHWALLLFGGVRYAHLAQNYNAFQSGGTAEMTLLSGHNFNGTGPTLAFEAHRRLGDTNLGLYSGLRGSLLFGRAVQQSNTVMTGAAQGFDDTAFRRQETMPILELEIGLEWVREMGFAQLFVQPAFIAQNWFGGGGAALGNLNSNLGFIGFSLATGVNF